MQDVVRLDLLLLGVPVDLVVAVASMLELTHHILLISSAGMALTHQACILKVLRMDLLI